MKKNSAHTTKHYSHSVLEPGYVSHCSISRQLRAREQQHLWLRWPLLWSSGGQILSHKDSEGHCVVWPLLLGNPCLGHGTVNTGEEENMTNFRMNQEGINETEERKLKENEEMMKYQSGL